MERHKVRIEHVKQNPYNTREDYGELAGLQASLRKFGFTQPLLARKGEDGTYEIAFGSRRLAAAKSIGLENVEVEIREITDEDMASLSLIENIHRKDLNPRELANAYNVALKASRLPVNKFAESIGESIPKVTGYLSILSLPERILKKSTDYRVHELVGLARLNEYSQTVRVEMEEVMKDRTLPQDFFVRMVRACARVYETNLPEKKKVEVCSSILWENYSQLGHGEEPQIDKFAAQILEGELIKHNEGLQKTEKARRALKGLKKVKSVSDIPNYDRKLDRVSDEIRGANLTVESAARRKLYEHASERSRKKFDFWVAKLVKGLEGILHNGKQ